MSGYDMKKLVDYALSHFWNVSYGRLYPTLKELEADGLVSSLTQKQRGKPDRIVYTITDRGRQALEEWLSEPSGPARVRNEMLLKLFFGHNVTVESSIAQLEAHREANEKLLASYSRYERMVHEETEESRQQKYFLLTIRNGVLMAEARIKWCNEAIETLRADGPAAKK
jgi:DNA-binding PadR family transcriptional regulator